MSLYRSKSPTSRELLEELYDASGIVFNEFRLHANTPEQKTLDIRNCTISTNEEREKIRTQLRSLKKTNLFLRKELDRQTFVLKVLKRVLSGNDESVPAAYAETCSLKESNDTKIVYDTSGITATDKENGYVYTYRSNNDVLTITQSVKETTKNTTIVCSRNKIRRYD